MTMTIGNKKNETALVCSVSQRKMKVMVVTKEEFRDMTFDPECCVVPTESLFRQFPHPGQKVPVVVSPDPELIWYRYEELEDFKRRVQTWLRSEEARYRENLREMAPIGWRASK